MAPWIKNVALSDIVKGSHPYTDCQSTILIQIVDTDMEHPTPYHKFAVTHKFKFLDIEEDGMTNFGDGELVNVSHLAINQRTADCLVAILQDALDTGKNVLVHCVAGVCRSGAVCEIGVMMGFTDTGAYRQPNILVKTKMMRSLGWTYEDV